jgi:hypothetical protein
MNDDSEMIIACYDNLGETIDRYTVYFKWMETRECNACLGMSSYPDHPQGVSMFGSGMPGSHNGKRVTFDSLPANIKIHVYGRMNDGKETAEPLKIRGGGLWVPSAADIEQAKQFHRENSLYYAIGGLS